MKTYLTIIGIILYAQIALSAESFLITKHKLSLQNANQRHTNITGHSKIVNTESMQDFILMVNEATNHNFVDANVTKKMQDAEFEYQALLKSNKQFQKMQLQNLQKLTLGASQADVYNVLGTIKNEEKDPLSTEYLLYTAGNMANENGNYYHPTAIIHIYYDTSKKVQAIVSLTGQNYVFGKLPESLQKLMAWQYKQAANSNNKEQEIKVKIDDNTFQKLESEEEFKLMRIASFETSGEITYRIRSLESKSFFNLVGVKPDDLIFSINDLKTNSVYNFMQSITLMKKSKTASILLKRNGAFIRINAVSELKNQLNNTKSTTDSGQSKVTITIAKDIPKITLSQISEISAPLGSVGPNGGTVSTITGTVMALSKNGEFVMLGFNEGNTTTELNSSSTAVGLVSMALVPIEDLTDVQINEHIKATDGFAALVKNVEKAFKTGILVSNDKDVIRQVIVVANQLANRLKNKTKPTESVLLQKHRLFSESVKAGLIDVTEQSTFRYVKSMKEFILQVNDETNKSFEDPLNKANVANKKMQDAEAEYQTLLKTNVEMQKMQLLNLQKIDIGVTQAKVYEVLGNIKHERSKTKATEYGLYTFGILARENNDYYHPAMPVHIFYDTSDKVKAFAGFVNKSIIVYGTLPESVQKLVAWQSQPSELTQAQNQKNKEKNIRLASQAFEELEISSQLQLMRALPVKDSYRIVGLEPKSFFSKIGVQPEDLLLSVNDLKVNSLQNLMQSFALIKKSKSASILLKRNGIFFKINATSLK